jgi:hypothetical protein
MPLVYLEGMVPTAVDTIMFEIKIASKLFHNVLGIGFNQRSMVSLRPVVL